MGVVLDESLTRRSEEAEPESGTETTLAYASRRLAGWVGSIVGAAVGPG